MRILKFLPGPAQRLAQHTAGGIAPPGSQHGLPARTPTSVLEYVGIGSISKKKKKCNMPDITGKEF